MAISLLIYYVRVKQSRNSSEFLCNYYYLSARKIPGIRTAANAMILIPFDTITYSLIIVSYSLFNDSKQGIRIYMFVCQVDTAYSIGWHNNSAAGRLAWQRKFLAAEHVGSKHMGNSEWIK